MRLKVANRMKLLISFLIKREIIIHYKNWGLLNNYQITIMY
ncbi:MAG: hypothetical protein K0R54_5362 [Clostridiaceae bacterium]|jgi:hypothetical protein|nr:hypothetical protein [Clostridiaceae bacterium]